MIWLTSIFLMPLVYFMSAGLAFAAMYRWPKVFDGLVLAKIYSPLEWFAKRSTTFARVYAAYLSWCYWRISPWRNTTHRG